MGGVPIAITGTLANNISGNAATATVANSCSGNAATATTITSTLPMSKGGTGSATATGVWPIGSIICMSTNSPPSFGTWRLVDKLYTYGNGSNIAYATPNATNIASIDTCSFIRTGHVVKINLGFTTAVTFTDSTFEICTLDFNTFGLSQIPYVQRFTTFSDGGQVVLSLSLSSAGVLSCVDVFQRNNTEAKLAPQAISYFTMILPVRYTHMLDNKCDKFFFQRTA